MRKIILILMFLAVMLTLVSGCGWGFATATDYSLIEFSHIKKPLFTAGVVLVAFAAWKVFKYKQKRK